MHLYIANSLEGFLNPRPEHSEILNALLNHGGDMRTKDKFGKSPCDYLFADSKFDMAAVPTGYFRKIELVGYVVDDDRLLRIIETDRDARQQSEYAEELARMKSIVICKFPRCCLYDFLVSKLHRSARMTRYQNFRQFMDECNGDLEAKFPHYGKILDLKVKRASRRHSEVSEAVDTLELILGEALPENYAEQIFKSFSLSSLKAFNGFDWDFLRE